MAKKKKGAIGTAIDHMLHPNHHENVEAKAESDAEASVSDSKNEEKVEARNDLASHPKFNKFKKGRE